MGDNAGAEHLRSFTALIERLLVHSAQAFQELLSFFELRKEFLFFSKGSGMHEATTAAELDWMPQVQHLMIDEILDCIERDARGIENAADDDGIVRGIIVAQAAECLVAAPGHLRPSHQAVKEAEIQIVKNLVEIIVPAFGALNALASAQLADELRLLRHGVSAGIFAVTRGMGCINRLAVELGDENVQDGIKHRFRRAFKKIREADEDASLAQADGAIDVGEAIETYFKLRQRRARAEIAICLFKDLGESGGHLVLIPSAAREPYWGQALIKEVHLNLDHHQDFVTKGPLARARGKKLFLLLRIFLIMCGFYIFTRHISVGLERLHGVLQDKAEIGRFFFCDRVSFTG